MASSTLSNFNANWYNNGTFGTILNLKYYPNGNCLIALDINGWKIHKISKTQPGGTNVIPYVTLASTNYFGMTEVSGDTIYIANGTNKRIYSLNLTTATVATVYTFANIDFYGITQIGNILYCVDKTNKKIQTVDITNIGSPVVNTSFITLSLTGGTTTPYGIYGYGSYIYVGDTAGYVTKYDATTGTKQSVWGTTQYASNFEIDDFTVAGNYLYAISSGANAVYSISLSDPTSYTTCISGISGGYGVTNDGTYLYATYGNTFAIASLPAVVVAPCFHEDSKILTNNGYVKIKHLKKGDLVKTCQSGYVPINCIGYRTFTNNPTQERIKQQLYICNPSKYPELTEPLIITGCHCILTQHYVDEDIQRKIREVNGDLYVTEERLRIPACCHPNSDIYDVAGDFMIYHIALENDNYYYNYGVYANGGLEVETCSLRYLKELSGMVLEQ